MSNDNFEGAQLLAVAMARHLSLIWGVLLETNVVTPDQVVNALRNLPSESKEKTTYVMSKAILDVAQAYRHKTPR